MYELAKYDEARNALAICASIDEVKDIQDKSEAMRLYAKMSENTELEIFAATIKLRAQVKLGEIIAGMEKAANQHALPTAGKSKKDALTAAKISTSTANRYEQLASVPETVLEKFIAQSTESGKPVSMPKALAFAAPPKTTETVKPATPPPATTPDPEPPQAETVTIPKHEYEELHAVLEEYKAESEATEAVFDADDKVAAAVTEIRKLTAKIALMETQKTGLLNQCNELKRSSINKDRQIAKLQRELNQYKLEEAEK